MLPKKAATTRLTGETDVAGPQVTQGAGEDGRRRRRRRGREG